MRFYKSYSFWAIFIFSYICIHMVFNYQKYKEVGGGSVFAYDMLGYYSYLPAHFIYDDLNLDFAKGKDYNTPEMLWVHETPIGRKTIKYPMGMAMLYSPYFAVAHTIAKNSDYQSDGFSLPYRLSVLLGCVLYVILGFLLLKKVLQSYFSDGVIAFTILSLGFGTNLFHYTVHESLMSHGASFMIFAGIMYFSIQWYEKGNQLKHIVITGLLGGLIAIIRPTNFLIMLFPLLYGIMSWEGFKQRIALLWKYKFQMLIFFICIALVIFPQLLYWKTQAGSWVYKAYPEHEKLYWTNPKLLDVLFSYRKGWFIYTPMAIFIIAGLFFVKRIAPKFSLFLFIYIPINIYVVSCWWCWWYGGGFGMRALIEMTAPAAIALASFWKVIWNSRHKWLRSVSLFAVFFIVLNMFQSFQYKRGYIHWDAMSEEVYWDVFGRIEISWEERKKIHERLDYPDYHYWEKEEKN